MCLELVECILLLAGVALQVVLLFSVRQTLDVRMADASLLAAGGLLIPLILLTLPIPLGLPLPLGLLGLLLPLGLLGLLILPLLPTRAGLTLVVVGGLPTLPLRHSQAGPTPAEAGQDLVLVELPAPILGEEVACVRQTANAWLLLCLLIVVAREEVVVDAESLAR